MQEEPRPRLLLNWNAEGVRARWRESSLAALVLHLSFVIAVLISPRFFYGNPIIAQLQVVRPDVTVLYLPNTGPDVPIPEARTPPDLTAEERQRAVVRPALTLDPEELERILTPPVQALPTPLTPPASPPPGSRQLPPGPGRGLSAGTPSTPGGNEGDREGRQFAQLQNVPDLSRNPNLSLQLPQTTAGRAIEESLRRSQNAPAQGGVPGGGGLEGEGPVQPNFNTPFPTILSDTRGVDFTPYLIRLVREVRRNWYAVIPESARRLGEQGKVVIIFTILKDGSVPRAEPRLVYSSGRSHLDRPALAAIRTSQPFPPLPAEFSGPNIVLQFTFLYNLPLDYTGP